jgi:hypothetical protein
VVGVRLEVSLGDVQVRLGHDLVERVRAAAQDLARVAVTVVVGVVLLA